VKKNVEKKVTIVLHGMGLGLAQFHFNTMPPSETAPLGKNAEVSAHKKGKHFITH
jgi:hypothetical protein